MDHIVPPPPKALGRQIIEDDLSNRIAAHRTKIAAIRALPEEDQPMNLLADGDSWFDYPLSGINPLISTDVIAQIPDLYSTKAPAILNLAHHGDATTQMMGVTKRARLVEQLNHPDNGEWDAILFSGGGNDLCGEQFRLWLHDAVTVGADPQKALDDIAVGDILGVVMTAYTDLLAARDGKDHTIPVVVHAYDFALPTNIGVCGLGPWLFPSFQERGWMDDPEVQAQLDLGASIVKLIMIKLDKLMSSLEADPRNNVVYVRTQGTLAANQWANELHPTPGGFNLIAQKFQQALSLL